MPTIETPVAEVEPAPTLVLPHLYYPFETSIHPDVERAEQDLQAWASRHGLLEDARWANGIRCGKVGDYCARVYANATYAGLCMTSRAYAWIFAIDDSLCSTHGVARSPGDLSAIYLWLYEMIADPSGYEPAPVRKELSARLPRLAALLAALQNATQDICCQIAAMATPAQYARWAAGMMTFLFSSLWEAGRYASNVSPGIAEYISGRTYNGCGEGAFSLIDVAGGYGVPEDSYADEEMQRLRRMSGLILCLCNDVFSYPKEAEAAESCNNLVRVLIRERQLTQQAALDEAAKIHDQYVERYLAMEARVRARADNDSLVRLLDDARAYVRGNHDWHFHSPRYGAAEHYDLSKALRPTENRART